MQLALCWRPLRTGGGRGGGGVRGRLLLPPGPFSSLSRRLPKAATSETEPGPVGTAPYLEESKMARPPGPGSGEGVRRSPQPQWLGGACNCVRGLRPAAILFPPYPLPRPRFKKPPPCGSAHTGFKAPPTTRLAPPLSLERALLIPRWCILVTLLGATQGPIKATINRITNELGFDSCTMEIHEGDKTWFTF